MYIISTMPIKLNSTTWKMFKINNCIHSNTTHGVWWHIRLQWYLTSFGNSLIKHKEFWAS